MKKYTFLLILVIGLFLFGVGVLTQFSLDYIRKDDAIVVRENSVAEVDAYLNSFTPQTITNEIAVAAIETGAGELSETQIDALYYYKTPEGFLIRSQSKEWNKKKLEDLYNELKLNVHGEELAYLYDIIIYTEADAYAAASHEDIDNEAIFSLYFPALPDSFSFIFPFTSGRISLYDGDNITTVSGMALSLSHEYGHHYTLYHMFREVDFFHDTSTEIESAISEHPYFQLRGLPDDTRYEVANSKDYLENHHWYAAEIAATDYVQLMGSPNARQVEAYKDIWQLVQGEENSYAAGYNAFGQENLMISTAAECEGLAEYFYSFVEDEAPLPAETKQEITLKIDKRSKSYNFVEGRKTFRYYEFTWNTPYTDATYTLVCIDEADGYELQPIKTIYPGEKALATIGTVTRVSGNYVNIYYDGYDEGTKVFYVVAMLSDGTLYRSDPIEQMF